MKTLKGDRYRRTADPAPLADRLERMRREEAKWLRAMNFNAAAEVASQRMALIDGWKRAQEEKS